MIEAIGRELTGMILDGTISSGSFLREVDLADRFGVSRQSVRAAMIELHHGGLLRHEAHRGFWVPRLSRQDVIEIFDVRELIETDAARKLAADPGQVAAAEVALARLVALPPDAEPGLFYQTHFDFHRSFVESVEPDRLVRFYDLLCAETWLTLMYSQNLPVTNDAHRNNRTHQDIIMAVRMGDPELAAKYTQAHLEYGRQQSLMAVEGQSSAGQLS